MCNFVSRLLVDIVRKSKVDEACATLVVQHDVVRLYVAVHETFVVHCFKCHQCLLSILHSLDGFEIVVTPHVLKTDLKVRH